MQKRPDGMKPIDTAPDDGSRITVWREGYGLYSVQWLNGAWQVNPGRTVPTAELTHWMPPLPPPTMAEILGISEEEYALNKAMDEAEEEDEERDLYLALKGQFEGGA